MYDAYLGERVLEYSISRHTDLYVLVESIGLWQRRTVYNGEREACLLNRERCGSRGGEREGIGSRRGRE